MAGPCPFLRWEDPVAEISQLSMRLAVAMVVATAFCPAYQADLPSILASRPGAFQKP
jgi:hypothetical protein